MKGRLVGRNVRSFPSNLLRTIAAALIAVGGAASANAQASELDFFPIDTPHHPPGAPRFSSTVFDAPSYNVQPGFGVNAALPLNGDSFAAPDGDFPSVFLRFAPQGAGNALPLSLDPDAMAYPFASETPSSSTSSSTRDAAGLYFSSGQQFTGGDSGAGGRATSSLADNQNNLDFRTTASAAEPSAVGLALAPFVFAGAALIRRCINRKKK